MQSAISRRQEILDAIMVRRYDTVSKLAIEFKVSERTIRRDICILSRDHAIEMKQGNGGGVRVMTGYYLDRPYFTTEQESMLRSLLAILSPDNQKIMREILSKFSKPRSDSTTT